MTTLLQIRDVRKHYPVLSGLVFSKLKGWIEAVDGVSFSIKDGETFGLVGESGCGKSTLAKLILRLEPATSGYILFRNKKVSELGGKDLREYRSSVQAVFQNPTSSLNPRQRVSSIVSEPLIVNTPISREMVMERVGEALSQVGLSPEAARLFPHEFSGGQRQRIALARSLILRPSFIVLDEPVSALDVSIQAQIMNLLKKLQMKIGFSYLFIAHNLATVRYMSHRIGVMYLGNLVEKGPADAVYSNRVHPYTKALFSAALPSHPALFKEGIVLSGEVPSSFNPPSGCRFHPRCEYSLPICHKIEPQLKEIATDHYVSCHLNLEDSF